DYGPVEQSGPDPGSYSDLFESGEHRVVESDTRFRSDRICLDYGHDYRRWRHFRWGAKFRYADFYRNCLSSTDAADRSSWRYHSNKFRDDYGQDLRRFL